MTKKPVPASPACVSCAVLSAPVNTDSQAVASSASVTAEAVANARMRGVITPAISTGSTNNAT